MLEHEFCEKPESVFLGLACSQLLQNKQSPSHFEVRGVFCTSSNDKGVNTAFLLVEST